MRFLSRLLERRYACGDAKYLRYPKQQDQIAKADFNPHVYDPTAKGFEHLPYHRPLERHTRPTGHWWHSFWVSSVSSVTEINATRAGLEYIPAARILILKNTSLAISLKRGKLIPDQLFAIKYTDGYRAFALEVDRETEPVRSQAALKSLKRSVAQYREVVGRQTAPATLRPEKQPTHVTCVYEPSETATVSGSPKT